MTTTAKPVAIVRARACITRSLLVLAASAVISAALPGGIASAQLLSYAPDPQAGPFVTGDDDRMLVAPTERDGESGTEQDARLPDRLHRTVVAYETSQPAGTVVIDTANTYLYYVLGGGRAIRYGVGVGREGFTWAGVQTVSRKAEWPDWHPPARMIARQPYLPRFMAGGPGNPLGARAMYLGSTEYRIHGTNDPSTIGKFVSSGCIRMTNEDVADLFDRVNIGTRVVVLPKSAPATARSAPVRMPGRQAMNVSLSSVD